ncbi:hypothetical protein ACO1O0_002336 [Amphichorda felina]
MEFKKEKAREYPHPALETDTEASEGSGADDALPSRRHATLYDAVAGTVLNTEEERNERRRGPPVTKHSTRDLPMCPDEVLFRRRGAPERYAEHDIYYAHERDLPRGGRGILPDNDLLKAIHSYSSQFYGAHRDAPRRRDEANVDERSMDETALLAFGILLEEAGREVLGHRGDLVFTEAAADAHEPSSGDDDARESSPRVAAGHQVVGSRVTPRKRRRVAAGPGAPAHAAMVDDKDE